MPSLCLPIATLGTFALQRELDSMGEKIDLYDFGFSVPGMESNRQHNFI
jgi:hypothetical protein